MKLKSLQQFKEDYAMLDDACRQWYDFISDDPTRADGNGFGEFYNQLCEIKYREYLNNPEDFYEFKPSFPIFISLGKNETETLATALDKTLCGHCEDGEAEILGKIYNNLENALQIENNREMTL